MTNSNINRVFFLILTCAHILFFKSNATTTKFSVFCTSNFDSTGECVSETNESLHCVMVPGAIINCKNDEQVIFECIQYGIIIAYQSQFACEPDTDNSVDQNIFSKAGNASNRNNIVEGNLSDVEEMESEILDESPASNDIDSNEFTDVF